MMYVESLLVLIFAAAIVLLFAWVLFDDAEIIRLVIWLKRKKAELEKGCADDNV